jgi:hypothetical protein
MKALTLEIIEMGGLSTQSLGCMARRMEKLSPVDT